MYLCFYNPLATALDTFLQFSANITKYIYIQIYLQKKIITTFKLNVSITKHKNTKVYKHKNITL